MTRLPYIRNLLNGQLPFTNLELHKRYGGVVRIAPDELSFNTAEGFVNQWAKPFRCLIQVLTLLSICFRWKDIYGNRVGKPEMAKNVLFYATTSSGSVGLFGSTRDRHGPLRRLVSHGFSEKALRLQELLIQQYCDLLMKRLRENCKDGTEMIDMVSWYNVSKALRMRASGRMLTSSLLVLHL